MRIYRLLIALLMVTCMSFCKQGPDPILQEALKINDEAIHLGMEINKTINEMIISDTTKQSHDALGQLLIRLKNWENEMISVPGAKLNHDHGHDHSTDSIHKDTGNVASQEHGHDHDHNHHGHVHATGAEIGAQLTPAENKEAQIEWKNRLLEIQADLEKLKKTLGK